jgi:hypothetical protein
MKNHTDNFIEEKGRPRARKRLEMVERFRRSGQTRRAFCESEGVAKSTLDWWLRRSRRPLKKKRVVFHEVGVISAGMGAAADWSMEMVSPQGWRIRTRQMLGTQELARLLRESQC